MDDSLGLRRYRAERLGVALVAVLWLACLLLQLGGETVAQVVSNAGQLIAPAAAGVCCLVRAKTSRARHRRFWVLLGAATLSWFGGQLVWVWYEWVLAEEVPALTLGDAGFLGTVPLAAAALLSLPLSAHNGAERARQVLDGLTIAVSLTLIGWVVLLGRIMAEGGETAVALGISLAYPAGDLVVATIVLFALARSRRASRRRDISLPLVAAGLGCIAVADFGFSYLTATEAYESGALIDFGWFAGFLLILLAARRPATAAGVGVPDDRVDWSGLLLPYGAVVLALVVSVVEQHDGVAGPVTGTLRLLLLSMLIIRQVLTLVENLGLASRLEARVLARTAELRSSEQRFMALVQHSAEAVIVIDRDGTVRYVSESMQRVFGYSPDDLIDRPIGGALDVGAELTEAIAKATRQPGQLMELDLHLRHHAGHTCTAQVTITNLLHNPSVRGLVLNVRDISERKRLEEELVHQAFHDSLTSLANRALFTDRLEHALQRARRSGAPVVVLYLDLDGFKEVNDTLGHTAGDRLLTEVAERLRTRIRPSDTIARLGGDEFAILIEDVDSEVDVDLTAGRILEALDESFTIEGRELQVRASMGIAAADGSAEDALKAADDLLRNADLAMYSAKAAGTGRFVRFDPDMHLRLRRRVELEADLRRALDNGELLLHYQPTYELSTGRLVGVEALARWRHPEHGFVPPDEFIPLAEASGLIHPIGEWVLRTACTQAAAWQREYPDSELPLTLNVNLSTRQLEEARIIDQVADALASSGLPASSLVLEVTESTLLMDREETLATLRGLRELGVRLAIDDFGTGYSALSYLHQFPVDVLKIDRSFVDRLRHSPDQAELVRTVVRLGQALRLVTVAEGVENLTQLQALRRMGCDVGQGYHFARPMPPEHFQAMLDAGHALPAGRRVEPDRAVEAT